MLHLLLKKSGRAAASRASILALAEFPENLAQDAEPDDGAARGQIQAADQAANLFLG